jgi:hypothetical protein
MKVSTWGWFTDILYTINIPKGPHRRRTKSRHQIDTSVATLLPEQSTGIIRISLQWWWRRDLFLIRHVGVLKRGEERLNMEDGCGHGVGSASVCRRCPRCGADSIGRTDLLATLAPVSTTFGQRSSMAAWLSLALVLEWIWAARLGSRPTTVRLVCPQRRRWCPGTGAGAIGVKLVVVFFVAFL